MKSTSSKNPDTLSSSTSTALTVEEAMQRIHSQGDGRLARFAVSVLAVNSTAQALEWSLMMFVSECSAVDFQTTPEEQASLVNAVTIGNLVGIIGLTPLGDIVGRHRILVWTTMLTFCIACASALAPNFIILISLRFLVGVMGGSWTIALNLLAECLPNDTRGFYMNITNLGWGVGSFFISLMAWCLIPIVGWRGLTVVASAPFLFSAVCIHWLQESPYWLASQGRLADAHASLVQLAQMNHCDVPCQSVIATSETASVLHSNDQPKEFQGYCYYFKRMLEEYGALFESRRAMLTLSVWVLWAFWSYAYTAIVLYDGLVLERSGSLGQCRFDYSFIAILASAEIFGALLVIPFLDRSDGAWYGGRKATQIVPFAICCGSLLLLGQQATPLVVWAYVSRLMICGGSGVAVLQAPELYPTSCRATGVGAASLMAAVGSLGAPVLVYGDYSSTWMANVIAFTMVVAIFAAWLLPETASISIDA